MSKIWVNRALALLSNSLNPTPQELNELDWKEDLSPDLKKLGKHLSAFANYPGGGFLVFGIENKNGIVNGISQAKIENILSKIGNIAQETLEPPVRTDHSIETFENQTILIINIKESSIKPVHIKSQTIVESYIRNAGSTRKASRHDIAGLLLNSKTPIWEELRASKLISGEEVLKLLEYKTIYRLLNHPIDSTPNQILRWMIKQKMVDQYENLGFYITNFGAISSAKDLSSFDDLDRKAIRVIRYKGKNKTETLREYEGSKGYAVRFEKLMDFLSQILPGNEIIKQALRHETLLYPEIALRELIANALIHQDFSVKGAGPVIEIFSDRIEISNPGKLLPSKNIDRLIRTDPESRNEYLAKSFRRYKICEERGSGLEKAVAAIELYGLPPLKFIEMANSFRTIMYAPKDFNDLTKQEKIEAAYQHSVLKYFASSGMTNTSLRERFKVSERFRPQVSLIIKEALELNRIKPKDPNNVSTKFVEYIPLWG